MSTFEDAGSASERKFESLEQTFFQDLVIALRMGKQNAPFEFYIAHPILQLAPRMAENL
jgi:hypothetical protein